MSKGIALWVWMCGTVVWSGHALADEAADIVKANVAAKASTDKLLAVRRNLHQMRTSLGTADKEAVDLILSSEESFDGFRNEAETVGMIFKSMDCKSDRTFVGAMFEEEARSMVTRTGLTLQEINADLPLLTNPAALAEATKLRDLIITLREIYLPLAPKT